VLLRDELHMGVKELEPFVERVFSDDDLTAPMASGSNVFDAFVILPASTSTIGKIASGIGDTLITRTAQVALKERYRLILCVRETPVSTIFSFDFIPNLLSIKGITDSLNLFRLYFSL
jgi:polyprenyl P-hydroxybenzoate/phenylacrylic acid decarboxylase-like protein